MLDKTKLPALSVSIVEDYFQKMDNVPFDSTFLLVQFYISRLLCSNRVRIKNETIDVNAFPNLYIMNLAPSGSNKDKHRKMMEKVIPFFFEDLHRKEAEFKKHQKYELEQEAKDKELSKAKAAAYVFDNTPRSLYSVAKSNATPEGLGATHQALYNARFGAIMWLDKEISDTMARFRTGSPLDELTTMIKESYDTGEFEPKLIKGEKMIKAGGEVPYLAWVHGAIDAEKGQELFRQFFQLGYGRRMILGLHEKVAKETRTIDQINEDMAEASKQRHFISKTLEEIYNRTAVNTSFEPPANGKHFTLQTAAQRRYIEYKIECENSSIDLPRLTSGIVRDEMKNRHWKALKLACVYAAQESTDLLITKKHLDSAIYTIEYFSKNLAKFMGMKVTGSLPDLMIHSIRVNGIMKRTDFYTESYFPKNKGSQPRIFAENIAIVDELLSSGEERLFVMEINKKQTNYKIEKVPEHFELIKEYIEKKEDGQLEGSFPAEDIERVRKLITT